VRAGDKDAVPILIGLLSDGPPQLAWRAEDLLCRAAGDGGASAGLAGEDDRSRQRCRAAWAEWWKKNGARLDLSRVGREEPARGLLLLGEARNSQRLGRGRFLDGRVWACERDGKPLWEFEANHPWDAHLLPGGRVLLAESEGRRVTERDHRGKVLWEYRTQHRPHSCQRLPNGNTFIATATEFIEVNRAGRVLSSIRLRELSVNNARKLPNGHVVCGTDFGILVVDAAGKEIQRITLPAIYGQKTVEPLPNGNYLVAEYNAHVVVEVDAAGKGVWQCAVRFPTSARRLPNGNVLVSTDDGERVGGFAVVEFDRQCNEVWKLNAHGPALCARRY
jgi:hypothetical protein